MEMFEEADVGVCVQYELTFENVIMIKKLLNECLEMKRDYINKKEMLFNTCWAYHIGENDSVPELARRFLWKFKHILNLDILSAVLTGENDEKLKEMFVGREEEEKKIIIAFQTYSHHFEKKHIKQKVRLVNESFEFFQNLGVSEEEIIIYKLFEGCKRGEKFLADLKN
jgi:hypothetical protein